jgi:hypothetical protein
LPAVEEPRREQSEHPKLDTREQHYAIKTWRYLRLAMVVLVVGLAVAVVHAAIVVPGDCWQTSISAYYYTSVHAYFIAALVSIGVCLFCLRGSTPGEDVYLNLAGVCAPVVGLVPTPDPGTCGVVHGTLQQIDDNVDNNVTALLAVGALALIILARLRGKALPSQAARRAYAVGVAAWLGTLLVFILDDEFFVHNAHFAAAGLMFFFIFIVVLINARDCSEGGPATAVRNRYGLIAGAMVVSVVGFLVAGCLGFDHWLLGVEIALIVLFAIFWGIQTHDLWDDGLRKVPA